MENENDIIKSKINAGEAINIELGCGQNKMPGYVGVDIVDLDGVDYVANFEEGLPFIPDTSVDRFYSRHVMEHISDFPNIQSEIYRSLKPGGEQEIIVPHFSSKYYYSDPTHKVAFGLYTMSYMSSNSYYKRKVPNFYFDFQYELIHVHLGFRSSRFPIRNLVGKYIFEKLFNLSRGMQEVYETFFSGFISCTEIRFIVRK